MKFFLSIVLTFVICVTLAPSVAAQSRHQKGHGHGPQHGRGFRGGHGHDQRHDVDRKLFHFLLTNHEAITRSVKQLPNGVETLTESKDPDIAAKIKEHVKWMKYRVEHSNPIRMRDPLFAELFRHTEKIEMEHENTMNGVRVMETSADPYVVSLIKKHAEVVSGFVERGFNEARKNHPVPKR